MKRNAFNTLCLLISLFCFCLSLTSCKNDVSINSSSDISGTNITVPGVENSSLIESVSEPEDSEPTETTTEVQQTQSTDTTSKKQTISETNAQSNTDGSSGSSTQTPSNPQQQTFTGWKFSDINVSLAEQECLNYINQKRAGVGSGPLATGTKISKIAKIRVNEIVINFTHQRKGDIYSENKYGFLKTVSDVPGWQDINWAYTLDENGNYYTPDLDSEAIGKCSFHYSWPYKDTTELSKKVGTDIAMGICGSPAHWAYIKEAEWTAGATGITIVDNKDGSCMVYLAVLLLDKLYE